MLRRWRTKNLVLLTAGVGFVVVVGIIGLILVFRNYGCRAETAALVAPFVALVIGLITLIANIYTTRLSRAESQESETQREQNQALQAYSDRMEDLLRQHQLRSEARRYAHNRMLARTHTLQVLRILDPTRKRMVLEFLREMRLINKDQRTLEGCVMYPRVVGLSGADLSKPDLRNVRLISTSRQEPVSLEGAILEGADLENADLTGADLQDVDLSYANLRGADLVRANLTRANLAGTDLTGANLWFADLTDARGATEEQLAACKSLEGATMPDRSEHD